MQTFSRAYPVVRTELAQISRASLYLTPLVVVSRPAAPTFLGLRGGALALGLPVSPRMLLHRHGGRAPVHGIASTRHTCAVQKRSAASCPGEPR